MKQHLPNIKGIVLKKAPAKREIHEIRSLIESQVPQGNWAPSILIHPLKSNSSPLSSVAVPKGISIEP